MATMWTGDDDAEIALAEAWRKDDPQAVQRLIVRYGPAMLRVAFALCPRAEDAEEVVQDALLQAHGARARFDSKRGSLGSWLAGVTANRARQVRRGQTRYSAFLARLRREPYEPGSGPSMSGDLAFARRRLAELPAREREAFVLVEMEELSSIEAARAMEVSDSTVRVLVARARKRLQRAAAAPSTPSLKAEGTGK